MGGIPEGGGGCEGEMGAVEVSAGRESRQGVSQDRGDPGRISMVVPGRGDKGRASRCSMKVTWKELKTFPVEESHRWYAFKLGAYLIKIQGFKR